MIKNLCVAAIRLLALYFGAMAGIQLISTLIFHLGTASSAFSDQFFVPNILSLSVTLALSVTLWVCSRPLAKLISPHPESSINPDISAQDFVLIGLCLLGAAILTHDLPEGIALAIKMAFASTSDNSSLGSQFQVRVATDPSTIYALVEASIRSVLGAGLLFFGFRLRPLLRKFQTLRTAGHDKPEPTSASERSERS